MLCLIDLISRGLAGKNDRLHGQVDLEGNSIYRWYLVGFWADIDGKYGAWSVELSYSDFWKIRSSDYFTYNKALFPDQVLTQFLIYVYNFGYSIIKIWFNVTLIITLFADFNFVDMVTTIIKIQDIRVSCIESTKIDICAKHFNLNPNTSISFICCVFSYSG